MATQPEGFSYLEAEVVEVKGSCSAGHKVGDKIMLGCWDTGGLCGFFYHDIFPSLSLLQFGGKYPWMDSDQIFLECPDRENSVKIVLRKTRG